MDDFLIELNRQKSLRELLRGYNNRAIEIEKEIRTHLPCPKCKKDSFNVLMRQCLWCGYKIEE